MDLAKWQRTFAGIVVAITISSLGCGSGSTTPDASLADADAESEGTQVDTFKPDLNAASDQENAVSQTELSDIVDTAVAAGQFKTLAAALTAADLIDTLKADGPFTVFAPTDDAFAKLPEGTVEQLLLPENKDKLISILTYHVVPKSVDSAAVVTLTSAPTVSGKSVAIAADDDGVRVGGANVIQADVLCSNGVIHIIDTVMMPPSEDASATPHGAESLTVEGVGSFATLFAAIEAAGLMDTLRKDGPFTVFAPTDDAFAALPKGTVENLLKAENKDKLVSILTYHVIPGRIPSEQVVELTSAKTVNGAELAIQVEDGTVTVGDATVLKTDVPCEVGLIHAIDKVLLP